MKTHKRSNLADWYEIDLFFDPVLDLDADTDSVFDNFDTKGHITEIWKRLKEAI